MEYNAKKELYHFVDRLRIDWGVTSYEQPFNAIEMSNVSCRDYIPHF